MSDRSFLSWPFFDDAHRQLADEVDAWASAHLPDLIDHHDLDGSCRRLVAALGDGGWLKYTVPAAYGGAFDGFDVRSLALIRETLARHDGLADFSFVMQGLGTGPITQFGTEAQKQAILPNVAAGKRIAAFALSEPDAGSDVAAMTTTAVPEGNDHVRIDGLKTWISNGGIADHYVVFARTGEAPGARGLSAFIVEATNPGLTIEERIDVVAPHPLATLKFDNCIVSRDNQVGESGAGFKVAMSNLDVFRTTVGAAALGLARRALDETLSYVSKRKMFGATLADLQIPQAMMAEMATDIDASALLIYRSAWTKDSGAARVTRESSMAKMFATEAAQSVIDKAVQLHGGMGVKVGTKVEELYREVRSLRIYEGATEVQKIVIARQELARMGTD